MNLLIIKISIRSLGNFFVSNFVSNTLDNKSVVSIYSSMAGIFEVVSLNCMHAIHFILLFWRFANLRNFYTHRSCTGDTSRLRSWAAYMNRFECKVSISNQIKCKQSVIFCKLSKHRWSCVCMNVMPCGAGGTWTSRLGKCVLIFTK